MTWDALRWSLLDWYIIAGLAGLLRVWLGWRRELPGMIIRMSVYFLGIAVAYPTSTSYREATGAAVVAWSHSPGHIAASCIAVLALIRIPGRKRSHWGMKAR